METARLAEIVRATTQEYRKGPAVSEQDVGGLVAVHVYDMPPANEAPIGAAVIDVHFLQIAVDPEGAGLARPELIGILNDYDGPNPLSKGPSYIEVGGVVGDQGLALRLFALGEVCGFWKVITPATFGIDGPMADQYAGAGFVLLSGYRPEVAGAAGLGG